MQEAAQANAEGSRDRGRELYRTAAKTYPTSKEPWLKLAEDYFDAANYGQAILAAQEVLQRDPGDNLAAGLLAVSGLRVSASALAMFRQQQVTLNGGTRSEAEDLARTLRDVLGEPVLVPAATPSTPARKRPTSPPRAAPAPTVSKAVVPSTAAVAKAPAAPPAPSADPFNVLKK